MTAIPRPSWLSEPCPPWCVREHLEDDHPEDRFHQSEARTIDLQAAGSGFPAAQVLHPVSLVVRAGRHAGTTAPWIQVQRAEGAGPELAISAGSARSLVAALQWAQDVVGAT